MGQQLTIFDCSATIRQQDELYVRLHMLQIGEDFKASDILVTRTERFYIVAKEDEYEEIFRDVRSCYAFVNTQLSEETWEESRNVRDKK